MIQTKTLQQAFSELRAGAYFGAGYDGNVTLLCKVQGRIKGKIMAQVMNGSWGIGFNTATLIAKPFGITKQHYRVMFVGALPEILVEKLALQLSCSDILNWMTKNLPEYLPPQLKVPGYPNCSESGVYQLDGGQTVKFHQINHGKVRPGTSDLELARLLALRLQGHSKVIQDKFLDTLEGLAKALEIPAERLLS